MGGGDLSLSRSWRPRPGAEEARKPEEKREAERRKVEEAWRDLRARTTAALWSHRRQGQNGGFIPEL